MAAIVTLTLAPALDCTTATGRVQPATKLRCDEPRYDAGGGGINVARLLHVLGSNVVVVFPAGGWTGRTLEELVRATGTPCRVVATGNATRQSLCVNERDTGLQYRFVVPGATLSLAEQQACLDALAEEAGDARFVILSGSLPPGVPPTIVLRIAECVRRAGARLIVDTSGPALREALKADAYLIKPDLEELEDIAGQSLADDAELERVARQLASTSKVDILLVSLAARGALIVAGDEVTRTPAYPITPAGGSGAGDSMVAGLVCGLNDGLGLDEAVRLGMAAGAAALLAPGTALANPAQIRRLFAGGQGMPAPAVRRRLSLR